MCVVWRRPFWDIAEIKTDTTLIILFSHSRHCIFTYWFCDCSTFCNLFAETYNLFRQFWEFSSWENPHTHTTDWREAEKWRLKFMCFVYTHSERAYWLRDDFDYSHIQPIIFSFLAAFVKINVWIAVWFRMFVVYLFVLQHQFQIDFVVNTFRLHIDSTTTKTESHWFIYCIFFFVRFAVSCAHTHTHTRTTFASLFSSWC